MTPASWVIVNKDTGKPVFETFNESVADRVNRDAYHVIPILEWLQSLNNLQRRFYD